MKNNALFFIVSLLLILSSCARTINLKVSSSELKFLDTIYYQNKNMKMVSVEWVFYEKNICSYSVSMFRKKTHIGTWTLQNDSIMVSFIPTKADTPKDTKIAIKDCEQK
ncbi:MAG: hypothetical protein AB8B65_20580 [Kordia sp.]|uniref:hypothetical protein n=1 Tax=Kordia sp. TaxID=1965332 RepID=UPI00385AAD1B